MPADPRRVKALFVAALDLPDDPARAAYLDRECGPDNELRQRVERLLAAHAEAASAPVPADLTADLPPDPSTATAGDPAPTADHQPAPDEGTVIAGKYKLLQQIGEGGMGTVWMAEQLHPVRRKVAVKLVRDGRDSPRVLARFEAERQALALMDHPHIAKVLDAGTVGEGPSLRGGGGEEQRPLPPAPSPQQGGGGRADGPLSPPLPWGEGAGGRGLSSGRPFFVMELVKGVPLTQFCDAHRLTVQQRLELFQQICSAVQHAHQKGIIHRDLKPGNVLVESHDGRPVPKVIDFGLAKAVSTMPLTDKSLFTAFGAVMGTPQYMAPEQASFNAVDVDTRADIYALGVILYELLTGGPPLGAARLRAAALDEVLRVIREEDPPTPSSRLSTADGTPTAAANRQIEPKRLGRLVRGDLDWIAMKALAKDRDRRYETANGFAADVGRFLAGEPVLAVPPSAGYRLRKFVRRNRPQVVAAGLVLLALLAGVIGTTLGLVEARRQEAAAVRERDEKEQARQAEADQRAEADRRRAEAEAARAAEADQRKAAEAAVVAEKAATAQAKQRLAQVERGARIIFDIFHLLDVRTVREGGQPLEAVLADRLAAAADQLDGEAVGDPLTVSDLQARLGMSLIELGFAARAAPLLEKARATRAAALGPDHADTLTAVNDLATALRGAGRTGDALRLYEDCLRRRTAALGPDHTDTLASANNLAMTYLAVNRVEDAIRLMGEALPKARAKLGPDHPDVLTGMDNLAGAYQNAGRADDAVPLHEESYRRRTATLGPDHPDTLTGLGTLAWAYLKVGRTADALRLHEECLRRLTVRLGPDHPNTITALNNLAMAYHSTGRRADALPLFEDGLRRSRAKYGPDHPHTVGSVGSLAGSYLAAGRAAEALPLFEEFLLGQRKRHGAESPRYANYLTEVARDLRDAGQFAAAEPYLRECLELREKTQPDDWRTFSTRLALAAALLGQGKVVEAEPLLIAGYEGMKAREKTIPPELRTLLPRTADRLVELYEKLGKPDEAARWRAERAKYPFVAPPPRPVVK